MINIKEIKEKCPKAYELLKQYIGNSLVEMQKRMANNVGSVKIEEIPPVDDRIIEGILVWNQRSLIDFAEQNNLKLSLGFSKEKSYFYTILFNDKEKKEKDFPERSLMEDACFTEIFNLIVE